mmetsp:Transcript_98787/g.205921  ORF Transcript_98787/g.205921 Transcript_98787/m.205921 type:complete len:208 (+) Transcript_98787:1004-1627(+)
MVDDGTALREEPLVRSRADKQHIFFGVLKKLLRVWLPFQHVLGQLSPASQDDAPKPSLLEASHCEGGHVLLGDGEHGSPADVGRFRACGQESAELLVGTAAPVLASSSHPALLLLLGDDPESSEARVVRPICPFRNKQGTDTADVGFDGMLEVQNLLLNVFGQVLLALGKHFDHDWVLSVLFALEPEVADQPRRQVVDEAWQPDRLL